MPQGAYPARENSNKAVDAGPVICHWARHFSVAYLEDAMPLSLRLELFTSYILTIFKQ